MDVEEFDYELPHELIAQEPLPERDAARLLVLPRDQGEPEHRMVRDLPALLRPGDVMVVNDAKVIPARLRGRKEGTGGQVELLLVEPLGGADWLALAQSSKPLRPGGAIEAHGARLEVIAARGEGEFVVRLPVSGDELWRYLDEAGETPLPPYIDRPARPQDRDRYQTIFARERGAVAAPTAGLHFTSDLLDRVRTRGVEIAEITLHVGYGTFQPVRVERVEDHRVEAERYSISNEAALSINRALAEDRRIIAVGTTTTRAVEAAALGEEELRAQRAEGQRGGGAATTDLFIYPGFEFQVINGLITNFHLPRSSLLMLVSAFCERELILRAYRYAIEREYRFYSYGDAMLII